MSAFNARLRPKEIFGLPLYAVGAAMVMLPAAALTILISVMALKVLFGGLGFLALTAAVFFLVVGRELPFVRLYWQARSEDGAVTVEAGRET